jgi:hypothetical protein
MEGTLIGPKSDDPLARNVPIEVADVHTAIWPSPTAKVASRSSLPSIGRVVGES